MLSLRDKVTHGDLVDKANFVRFVVDCCDDDQFMCSLLFSFFSELGSDYD